MRKNLLWLVLISAFAISAPSFAEDSTEAPEKKLKIIELPGEIKYRVAQGYDALKHRLADLFFDQIDDFKVYEFSGTSTSMQVRLGRSIYDNHDVFNSYTVVDTMTLPFTLYAWSEAINGSHFSLGLSVGWNFQFRNLRQVSRTKLSDLEDIDKKAKDIGDVNWEDSVVSSRDKDNENDPPYKEIEDKTDDDPLYWLDSLNRARFRAFWNMAAFPARLPFKADWLSRLDNGEIMVYGGTGFIEAGPSFGYSKSFKGFSSSEEEELINVSAYWRFLLMGEFRIAIMKEDDNFVKVKIRRHLQSGQRAGIGSSTSRMSIYDGFAIFGKKVGISTSIMPFSLSWSKTGGPILELGYRFDMRDPEAREAYEKAVMGRLAMADDIALKQKDRKDPAVERIFKKKGKETTERIDRSTSLVIYKKTRSAAQRRSDVKLELKDGKHRLYTAIAENTFESRFFFGSRQRLVTKSTIDYNRDSVGIMFEGWIEDSMTDALELNAYEDIVEKTLSRGKIFERVPIYAPGPPEEDPWGDRGEGGPAVSNQRIAETGSSSFYYRMDFNRDMIDTFLNMPETDKWSILEKTFGVADGSWQNPAQRFFLKLINGLGYIVNLVLYPLDVRIRAVESLFIASSAHSDWEDLKTEENPRTFTYNFGRFFSDSVYGPEMMEIFSRSVAPMKPPFYLTASNYSFGRINLQEGSFSDVGQTLEEYRRASRIDEPQPGYNATLAVKSFSATIIDETHMRIDFELPVTPKYLYFRVAKSDFLEDNKEELVVLNYKQAKEGLNTIFIAKEDGSYRGALARGFDERGYYNMYFGIGTTTRDWGPVISNKVYYQYGEEKKPQPLVNPEVSPSHSDP